MGMHVILSFAAGGHVRQVIERSAMDTFKHRLLTQMSSEDSFLLARSELAAKLQRGEAKPVLALYLDATTGSATRFKPYTTEAQIPWAKQIGKLVETLGTWRKGNHVNG